MLQPDEPTTTTVTAVATEQPNQTYECCCLSVQCVPPEERSNYVGVVWNFYWEYIHFALFNGAKACVPAILILTYLLQPGHQEGLMYTGLYAYIMTFYLIQWGIYEFPMWNKNDMYGNHLHNVPAYYWFMNHYYTERAMFSIASMQTYGAGFGWIIMATSEYKDKTYIGMLFAFAVLYAIMKTYLCIACSMIKYDVIVCNSPTPLEAPPKHILTPLRRSIIEAPADYTYDPANVSTWNCICCIVKAHAPIAWICTTLLFIFILAAGVCYIFLAFILLMASMNKHGSYCTLPILSIFVLATHVLYFTAPTIRYYLHDIDPQNTRFERVQFMNKDEKDVSMQIYYSMSCLGFVSCIIGWIYTTTCYTAPHNMHYIGLFEMLCVLLHGIFQIPKVACDMSQSPEYNEELTALCERSLQRTSGEVINPLAPVPPAQAPTPLEIIV